MNAARLDDCHNKLVTSSAPRLEITDLPRITEDILIRYSFYRESTGVLQEKIRKAASYNSYQAGDYLFSQCGSCERVFLVGRGRIRLYTLGDTGREITLYHVGPGEICPINMLCVMIGGMESATARVVSDLEAVMLPAADFRKWMAEEDSVRRFALESLSSRFHSVISLVGDLAFRKMDERLAHYLCCRFRDADRNPSALQLTHEQIAMDLGSAREVVSRILRNFEQNGAIKLGRGYISLLDESLLQAITGNA